MSYRPTEDLTERPFRFSCDVFDYCVDLERVGGLSRRVAYQLFDAASSVGANRTEANSAYSDGEFASKNAIALKECRESRFWLRLAHAKKLGRQESRARLLVEVNELVSIYIKVVKTLQEKNRNSKNKSRRRAAPSPSTRL